MTWYIIDRHRYRIIKDISIYTCELLIYCIYIYVVRWELCGKQQKMCWCAGASPRHRAQSLWGLEMRWTDPSSHANPYQPRTMAVSPWCTYPLEPVEPLSASTGFMWNKLQGCAVFCFSWFRRRFCKKLATQCHRMPKKEILCALNRVSLSHTFTFFPTFARREGWKVNCSVCAQRVCFPVWFQKCFMPCIGGHQTVAHWSADWHFFWTNMSAESVGIFDRAMLCCSPEIQVVRVYSWKASTL